VKNEAVALIETVEEETTEDTRAETDKVDDSNETTEATEATTVTVATGIVQNVKILTSPLEPNATDAGNLVAVETVDEAMTVVAVETTEDTRAETDKVDDSNETTEATEATTVTVATGIVQNVKILTSPLEPNATDAGNLVAVEAVDEAMTVEAVETTVVTGAVVVEKSTMTTIGIVQSAKIRTSHSDPNATDAVSLVAVEAVGEAMTAEVVVTTVAEATEAETVEDIRAATDKVEGSIETTETTEAATKTDVMATGIVQSVKIQTSHSEPNATDAAHHVAVAVAVAEAVAVDLVSTLEIDHNEATLEDDLPEEIQETDHHEEKATDHQEGTVETDVRNVGIKTADHTIKIVHEATSVNQNANPESHAHFANPEETAPAMPTTDLRNH
jgi:hypothetical protein